MSFSVLLLTRISKAGLPMSCFYLFQKDYHRSDGVLPSYQLQGVCKEGPVVSVHMINTKGLGLIERGKAESQAMMVMSDNQKDTNFEKRY